MLNRRFQILFDKDLWNNIVKSAKSQNISAGEFIRQSVRDYMDKQKDINKDKRMPFKGFFKRKS